MQPLLFLFCLLEALFLVCHPPPPNLSILGSCTFEFYMLGVGNNSLLFFNPSKGFHDLPITQFRMLKPRSSLYSVIIRWLLFPWQPDYVVGLYSFLSKPDVLIPRPLHGARVSGFSLSHDTSCLECSLKFLSKTLPSHPSWEPTLFLEISLTQTPHSSARTDLSVCRLPLSWC